MFLSRRQDSWHYEVAKYQDKNARKDSVLGWGNDGRYIIFVKRSTRRDRSLQIV